jgi:hypothetical protein
MLVVGFDEEPPVDIDAVLGYAAFDPNSAGKNLWGKTTLYTVNTKVKGCHPIVVKFLDENIHSDYLTLIFKNAIPDDRLKDELFTRKRVQQVKDFTAEFVERLFLTPEYTFEQYGMDDMAALVFKDAAPKLDEILAKGNRETFALLDTPPKE